MTTRHRLSADKLAFVLYLILFHGSWTAWVAFGYPRMRALGDLAGWTSQALDSQEASLRAGVRPGDPGFGANPPGSLSGQPYPTRNGDYGAFYAGLVDALRGSGPNPVDPWDAVASLKVIEAARASLSLVR